MIETIVDQIGKTLTVGQTIRVQRCVGPYGQTEVVEGTIEQLHSELRGATLRATKPTMTRATRTEPARPISVGEVFYVALPGVWVKQVYVCKRTFVDFEHGHEVWVEVLENTEEGPVAPGPVL